MERIGFMNASIRQQRRGGRKLDNGEFTVRNGHSRFGFSDELRVQNRFGYVQVIQELRDVLRLARCVIMGNKRPLRRVLDLVFPGEPIRGADDQQA